MPKKYLSEWIQFDVVGRSSKEGNLEIHENPSLIRFHVDTSTHTSQLVEVGGLPKLSHFHFEHSLVREGVFLQHLTLG
jgi:hypothetical protein